MSLNKEVLEDRTLIQLHHVHGESALRELCNAIHKEMLVRIDHLKQNGTYEKVADEIDEIFRQAVADQSETISD